MNYFAENKCRSCSKVFCCKNCRENHEVNKHSKIPDSSFGSAKQNTFKTPQERQLWPQYCIICNKVFQNWLEFNQQRKCAVAIGYRREIHPHAIIKICEDNESPPFLQTGDNFKASKNISTLATSTPMQRSDNIIQELGDVFKTPDDIVENSGEPNKQLPNQTGSSKRRVTFGSVSTPRPSASPIRESIEPIRESTSPIRESTSPIRESTSPVRSSTSPVRSSTSPVRSSTSPIRSSTGSVSNRMSNDNRSAASQGTFYTANEEFLRNNVFTPNPVINEEDHNASGEEELNNGREKDNDACEQEQEECEDSIWVSAVNITNSFLYDAQILNTDLEQQLLETTNTEDNSKESDIEIQYTSEMEEYSDLETECDCLDDRASSDQIECQQEDSNISQVVEVKACETLELNPGDANDKHETPKGTPEKILRDKIENGTDNNNTSKTENDKDSVSNNDPPEGRRELFGTPVTSSAANEAVHKVLRMKFGNTVKISSTPVNFKLLSVQNTEDLVTSGSNLDISNIKPDEIQNDPCTSATQSVDENSQKVVQGGLWRSITRVIENAVSMVQGITRTVDGATNPTPSGSLKRYSSSFDLSDQPAMKRFKLTDIKCRRAIRDVPSYAISRNSRVNIVNNFSINIVSNYNNRVKIYVDKSTQTDE